MRDGRAHYLVAEARYYWCGTLAGTLEGGWPLQLGALMFRPCGEHLAVVRARLNSRAFRCGQCGGGQCAILESVEDWRRHGRQGRAQPEQQQEHGC
jgi:hypothetical protein